MDKNSKLKLNNGVEIPVIGLGTYLSKPGADTYNSVTTALKEGYRHIDTAAFYKNEEDVGRAVKDSGISRDKIFLTTKVWNGDQGYDNTIRAFERSRKLLGVDKIDLYLIHWPQTYTRKETWKAMEKINENGLARSIGVSNYTIRHINEIFEYSGVVPVVNQVEFSLFLYQKELQEFCESKGIFLEAYTPLTRGKRLGDHRLVQIAEKYGKTPAQILIRWTLQVNTITLPKSVHEDRIKENFDVFDFNIDENDMKLMATFNENYRTSWNPTDLD